MTSRGRRVRRHVFLGVGSAVGVVALGALLPPPDLVWRTSMATAYVALGWFAASLLLGPWNVWRRRPNPISTKLRRDVGIWAGIVGLIHVGVGLFVHQRGRPWLYFVWPDPGAHRLPLRYDEAGLANWPGLAATFLLAGLLALSNDRSLRWLGSTRWKALQRWTYGVAILVVFHGVLYQLIERRTPPWVAVFAVVVAGVLAAQLWGRRLVRRGGRGRARPAAVTESD